MFAIVVVFYNFTWHSDNTMNAQKYATKIHIKMPLIYTGLRACFCKSVVGGVFIVKCSVEGNTNTNINRVKQF